MFDQFQNAEAIKRVERKNKETTRAAYSFLLSDEKGRWLVANLMDLCKIYAPANSPEEEGARRVAVLMRNNIAEAGLLAGLQLAENEYEAYKRGIQQMLEQTDAKEE